MNEHPAGWWGFRITAPRDRELAPITRAETMVFFLIAAGLALFAWAAGVALLLPVTGAELRWPRDVAAPLGIAILALVLGLFFPPAVLGRLTPGAWLALSRESGGLRTWDTAATIAGVVLAIAAMPGVARPLGVTVALLMLTALLIEVTLAGLQERLEFRGRRWRVELPEWLRETDEVVGPDPGAAPLYAVVIQGSPRYEVGVRIPEELLDALRRANAASSGVLYKSEPAAVALMDRPPAPGGASETMIRLCRQLGSIAQRHGLSRFDLANLVLGLVQGWITYRHDEDSTRDFPGGPYGEYGRFPLETLHDGVGDCECTSLLCASILGYMGFDCALLFVTFRHPERGDTAHHVAVGVSIADLGLAGEALGEVLDSVPSPDGEPTRYLYGETALDGARLPFGAIPSEWKVEFSARAAPVSPAGR